MKYRIFWKRKGDEKACGWGEPIFDDYETAYQVAEEANRKYPQLFHWVESGALTPPPPQTT